MGRSESAYETIANIIEGDIPPEIEEINRHHALTMWGRRARDPGGTSDDEKQTRFGSAES